MGRYNLKDPRYDQARVMGGIKPELDRVRGIACDQLGELESLRAEIERRDRFSGCDGCSTGDCPHGTRTECINAQAAVIAEQAARIQQLDETT